MMAALLIEKYSMQRAMVWCFVTLFAMAGTARAADTPYFRITAVDNDTGRGIPMVRFTLDAADLHHYTDSRGVIAFREPGLMGEEVYFRVEGHGYDMAPDEHGDSAVVLFPEAGKQVTIRLQRRYAAERLYRISGLAPHRDSRLLGDSLPTDRPPLLARVMGQDSVFVREYRGKLFWIWGDSFTPFARTWGSHYEVTAATSALPGPETFDPDKGVSLNYFIDGNGNAKKMVAADDGGTVTWFDGLVNLSDGEGEHLFAHYVQMEQRPLTDSVPPEQINHPLGMWWSDPELADWTAIVRLNEQGDDAVAAYRRKMESAERRYVHVSRGLMEFDDDDELFRRVVEFPLREADDLHVGSHALQASDGDVEYIWYTSQFPNRRVRDSTRSIREIEQYEAFTCLKQSARFDSSAEQLDRTRDGTLRWSWKKGTSPIGPDQQAQLVAAGHIQPVERWIAFRDVEAPREITTQHNTIRWNPHRHRYVGLFSERTDKLNKTFYGEADTPIGPWVYLQQVVGHNGITFYNPCLHFERDAGRTLYFEGTVTLWQGFGKTDQPSLQHYDYNQMMYRLSLDDRRLFLPVSVYHVASGHFVTGPELPPGSDDVPTIAFFAPDQPRRGTIPIHQTEDNGSLRLTTDTSSGRVAFYAESADTNDHSPWTVPLYEDVDDSGRRRYSVDDDPGEGRQRSAVPICFVWPASTGFNPWNSFSR